MYNLQNLPQMQSPQSPQQPNQMSQPPQALVQKVQQMLQGKTEDQMRETFINAAKSMGLNPYEFIKQNGMDPSNFGISPNG